ncbi:MAG: transglycosylase SLT domain-containing protein [Deltaproteobacteria bacterium]|nr:transglycosylase SLT domain-containing protein [Deltaproteobacteria bacterium]
MKIRRLTLLVALAVAATSRAEAATDPVGRLLSLPIPRAVTFCGETVPLDREDVVERLDLELMDTLASPLRTALWLKRLPRHLPAIEATLRRRGLPQDLKFVALIESNLRDDAVSDAGAVGPWQFMRETGAAYGLERTDWRDDARNWSDATEAALQHLSELRQTFGSWPLALAAYNGGQGRVRRALEAQGESEFYGLRLPRETERYVFRAIAAKLVVENPEAYGIQMEAARLYFPEDVAPVEVRVERRRVPVRVLAAGAGASYRWFLRLNPWIVGTELPRGTHTLRVPKEGVAGVQPALVKWEAKNPDVRTVRYRVKRGDTLKAIARRHNVGVDEIRSWNHLGAQAVLKRGQELVLYVQD